MYVNIFLNLPLTKFKSFETHSIKTFFYFSEILVPLMPPPSLEIFTKQQTEVEKYNSFDYYYCQMVSEVNSSSF